MSRIAEIPHIYKADMSSCLSQQKPPFISSPTYLAYSMRPTQELAQSPLFTQRCETLSTPDRIKLSYERAKALGKAYGGCFSLPFQFYHLTVEWEQPL
jgi:hypothetical protein